MHHDIPKIMKDCALHTKITLYAMLGILIALTVNVMHVAHPKIQPFLTQWFHDYDNLEIPYRQLKQTSVGVINGKRVNKAKTASLEATHSEIYVKSCNLVDPYAYHYYNMMIQLANFF